MAMENDILLKAVPLRHSVRSYTDCPLSPQAKEAMQKFIDRCNSESGLNMQLVLDEPEAFSGRMAHYGKFSGVRNYIALVGPKGKGLDEKCGYYGEKAVLYAQSLGLNSCWVGLTFSKVRTAFTVRPGEKLCLVIALGYGQTKGSGHKIKTREQVCETVANAPEWFLMGLDAALLAPTAMNQQKFTFSLEAGERVKAKASLGFFSKVDLGIVKCHFELAAGVGNFRWA